LQNLFERLTGQQSDPVEARNGLRHVVALSLSKISDGLIDPKLVLSWLLGMLGVPAALIGMLVPIREAGALLPQVVMAGWLQRMTQRRWVWVMGSMGQGVAALWIALTTVWLEGWIAGLVVCAILAGLAVSRAACSVSYKDILGKTVGQARRGAVTGSAGSVASAVVFVFALLLVSGILQTEAAVIAAIALAGVLWILAALTLSRLKEGDSATDGPKDAESYWRILREDRNLRRFIVVRGLLVSTALAPPYLVVLGTQAGSTALGMLGALVLASSAAGFVSAYVWGWLADRSSRLMLLLAGVLGALTMAAAMGAHVAEMAGEVWVIPTILFGLMVAYHGVRQARSTYLVDISPQDRRSVNAAVANTLIGVILLVAGLLGGALTWIGPLGALTCFSVMSLMGGVMALWLRPV
jgi:MFS family permease